MSQLYVTAVPTAPRAPARGEEGAAEVRAAAGLRGLISPLGCTVALPSGEWSCWNSLGSFLVGLEHFYNAIPGTHLGHLSLKSVWDEGCT